MNNIYKLFLKKFVFNEKRYFILVCMVTILQSVFTMCIPLSVRILLDKAFPDKDIRLFIIMVVTMFCCYGAAAGLNVWKDYLLSKIAEGLSCRLRVELNKKISLMKFSYFDQHSLSEILSKYGKEVDVIKENCGYMLIKSLSNVITFLLAGTMIIIMDWRIMVVSCILLIVYIINNRYWGKKVKELTEQSMKCNEKAINSLTENYINVLITKIYSAYEYVNKKFQKMYMKQYKNQINLEVVYSVNINSSGLLIYLLAAVIWLIGGFGVITGQLTIGSITALINYQGMLISPLAFFSELNNSYQSTIVAMERICNVLEYGEENNEGEEINDDGIKSIRFKDVDFGYIEGKSILENVNLKLMKGKVTAFIGSSGCGKSSIVKMIMRLYDIKGGDIYINNQKICELSVRELRERIAFVTQDSLFYEGSIIDNLNMGREKNKEKRIEYSKLLDLYDEIEDLPDKWDTELNSGTSNLSGGQKKRLDVLRALLKDSDVLIFDESTASIDIGRRKMLFKLIDKIKAEKIIIFITHNIEECIYFDDIYAVKNKRVNYINIANLAEAY